MSSTRQLTEQLPFDFAASNASTAEPVADLRLLLTIRQAASALGIGRSTVYELIARGDLEVVHIGRSARVPVDALRNFVERLRPGR